MGRIWVKRNKKWIIFIWFIIYSKLNLKCNWELKDRYWSFSFLSYKQLLFIYNSSKTHNYKHSKTNSNTLEIRSKCWILTQPISNPNSKQLIVTKKRFKFCKVHWGIKDKLYSTWKIKSFLPLTNPKLHVNNLLTNRSNPSFKKYKSQKANWKSCNKSIVNLIKHLLKSKVSMTVYKNSWYFLLIWKISSKLNAS